MKKKLAFMVGPLALGIAALAMPVTAVAAAPSSSAQTQSDGQDLGPSAASDQMAASIVLKIHNQDGLAAYIQSTTDPSSPLFHKYLSVNQFTAQYAPDNGKIQQVVNYLQQYGLTVTKVFPNNLVVQVSGTVGQFNKAFNVDMHDYSKNGKQFHAPKKAPKIPVTLQDSIIGVFGLSTESMFKPMNQSASQAGDSAPQNLVLPKDGGTATGVPMQYTVGDVANRYDVNPLYDQGITGKGQTIGIVTLADFLPQDAYDYWNAIGLKVKPDRITQIHVDGGGVLSGDAGSGETSLDVEQSGGLAPDADIAVYDAPNTDAGFIDAFNAAVGANKADSLSVSWGLPEIDYTAGMNGGVDYTYELQAYHQVYMEAAAQGISMFAASGDSGAYDTNRGLPAPYFSTPLSVDSPASDPYMTAAGGTTLPMDHQFRLGHVTIQQERPWAWDYLANLGYTTVFSVGDGGGVSVMWGIPWYQQGVPGMNTSEKGQSFIDKTVDPPADLFDLPANYAGRNVADLSMNADPETGYLLLSTPDGGWIKGMGGTSFVAPQLNGMTALMNQAIGGRVGFLNPTLYRLQQKDGYGTDKPFNDIATGETNWYYKAVPGYDDAVGIGTPNWANLVNAVKSEGK